MSNQQIIKSPLEIIHISDIYGDMVLTILY